MIPALSDALTAGAAAGLTTPSADAWTPAWLGVAPMATLAVEGPVLAIALTLLGLAMMLALYRLAIGPSIADRVVALDLLGFFAVGIIAIWSVVSGNSAILSVAIVMALILFLGTAAFASYLERRARP